MLLASLRRPTVDHDVSPPPLPASLCTVPAAANPDFKPSPGAALCGFEPLFTTKGVEWHRRRRPSEERRRCPRSRSEEHTSELQSLMRISYAVFCLKKKNKTEPQHSHM